MKRWLVQGSSGRRVILSLPRTTCVLRNGVSGYLQTSSFSFASFPREEKEMKRSASRSSSLKPSSDKTAHFLVLKNINSSVDWAERPTHASLFAMECKNYL